MWQDGFQTAVFGLDVFAGLTAIIAGIAMAAGVRRQSYPFEELEDTPFSSNVVTGIVLLLTVGVSSAFASVITANNAEVGGINSMIAGCILMGWTVGEIWIMKYTWGFRLLIDLLYFVIGLAMLAAGFMLYQ